MFETFGRSWQLVKESFNVLKKDKEIMLFPILSGAVSILVFATFILPIFLASNFDFNGSIFTYVVLFLYYLVSYFVVIFFNVGLITCANIRLNGGDPTFMEGIRSAFKNIHKILIWALISATVGLILKATSERSRGLGRLAISLLGIAWNLLTFFVIPVMIFENTSVIESIKRSGAIFRKTWGENFVGQFSIGAVFAVFGLLGIIPIILAIVSGSLAIAVVLFGIAILYWVILAIISSSLNGIFTVALYNFATKGTAPAGFSEDVIRNAWKPKV